MLSSTFRRTAFAMAALAVPAVFPDAASAEGSGTADGAAGPLPRKSASLGAIAPAATFTRAAFGVGGVGLRNRLAGGIEVSASSPPTRAAFLYWAVITSGPVPAAAKSVSITRRQPAPASSTARLTGVVVGTGPQPCWSGDTISVLKASVPTSVASGNGLYEVVFPRGASGLTTGADPFSTTGASPQVLPLLEGAALVVVGTGSNTVHVYDRGLSGSTFVANSGLDYELTLPTAAGGAFARFDSIGADGQYGRGRLALSGLANEVTRVNGAAVAGPGSPYNDSDWNGALAGPTPQLWDVTSHDVTAQVSRGSTSVRVSYTGGTDCLTPVANVVAVR